MKYISSKNNEHIKSIRALIKDKKARIEENSFVCEGVNLVKDIPSFALIKEIYIKESKQKDLESILSRHNCETYIVEDSIFDYISDTENPSGIIAVLEKFKQKNVSSNFIVLLDGLHDPGNVGTIIRTCAAKDIKDVILVNCCEIYSPKCIRATMGGIFYINCIELQSYNFDMIKDYNICSLDMNGENIFDFKLNGKTCLCVGSEAHGISKELKEKSNKILSIPMHNIESLNASISMAIGIYALKKE